MVNIIQEKLLKENFKVDLDKNKILDLKISSESKLNLTDKDKSNLDLTKLISCSQNYFEDLIKIYSNNELVLKVNSNLSLNISGSGILYILIEDDCFLDLNFIENLDTNCFIKILVKENVNFNLIENINNNLLNKFIEVKLLKNSKIKVAQFIFNAKITQTKINLFENSKSDLKSTYYIKNSSSIYINTISHHIQKNSSSNLQVSGIVFDNSKVINDGKIRIEEAAINSKGLQNMKNLILDEKSKVISEPILEIFNNEVICSHGSSISNISKDILFYLETKNLNENDIQKLLIESFFNLVLENISNDRLIVDYLTLFEKL